MESNLLLWEPKHLTGDDSVEVRVHSDGAVMWHRHGCPLGGKEGALAVGIASDLPYSAFIESFRREQPHGERGVLFCGGCLIYQPSAEG